MSTPKHTPGPWGIEKTRETLWIGPLRQDGKVNEIVAAIETDQSYIEAAIEMREANARLIAAAPDLLEACEAFLWASCEADSVDARRIARAAIAKAEGRV